MKKMFSLVLALVMALSLTTVAWGATEMPAAQNGVINLTENVTLSDPWVVTGNTTLNLNGYTISNTTDIWDTPTDAWSLISVQGGTLTINGPGTVKAKENDCYAVDVRNGAACVINGGEYIGNVAAAYVLEGTLTVNSGYFAVQQQSSQNGYGEVLNCYDANYTAGTAKVIVNGGIYENFNPTDAAEPAGAEQSYVASGYEAASVGANGEFIVGKDIEVDTNGNITGGTFTDDMTDYLASTAGFVTNPDGSVSVGAKATTGTYDLYSCNNTAVAAATGLSYTKVAAAPKTDGTGTIAYVAVDNGKNYMEISSFEATKADFYVTVSGSKTAVMYLREVSTVSYVASAKEFTNFGYGCGQYTKAYGDTIKYYPVLDGASKNRVFRAETTGLGFLVDGKIVQLATEVTLNAHTWSATAVDTVTGVPTKAICGKCSTTGTVYASAAKVPAAAVIDVTALSYNGVSYPVVAGYKTVAGPVTPSTDKVTSAETFDAGIAMYVGMSVMAAAGSAVVIGKKKD